MVIDSWGTYNEELYCLPREESAGTTICYREDWVFSALSAGQTGFKFVLGVYWVYVKRV